MQWKEKGREGDGLACRSYRADDLDACLALFDSNCPVAFAPNEREEYAGFLHGEALAGYEVCAEDGEIVGAFGLLGDGDDLALCWILLAPGRQRSGLGTAIMERVLARVSEARVGRLRISTSHLAAPFFARFGARELEVVPDGWGPGMHRVEMEVAIASP